MGSLLGLGGEKVEIEKNELKNEIVTDLTDKFDKYEIFNALESDLGISKQILRDRLKDILKTKIDA